MDKFVIEGPAKLQGQAYISGSKNASLPMMAAAILTDEEVILSNVPKLKDIDTMCKLLIKLNCKCKRLDNDDIFINCSGINSDFAPYELVKTMRASILVFGPLLARLKSAHVSLPGGCAIGVRPVNLHIAAMKNLGADVEIEEGYIVAKAERLEGATIYFDTPTVTGTENVLMAAALTKGKTIIKNAAKEPEVVDLAKMLKVMGAKIKGEGESTIEVEGVSKLRGVSYRVMSDRIEAGTFMCASLITGSTIELIDAPLYAMDAIVDKFIEVGGSIRKIDDSRIEIKGKKIEPVVIKTAVYPGFPTDMQAQFMAVLTLANGTSVIEETIFENRFMHVAELIRLGANILISGNKAVIEGVSHLDGATVMATDLRASASLVIAGLAAHGRTEVLRIYHLDRGYEALEKKLSSLGANIKRVKQ
ncbi:UDP-N-acetylglucosamine 1-carboxyvinyltransferase [Hippea maritima]|uniref:UDP-N-acetylglucosamine 1-carboxyvinyltransferase n=1 Tax=Hippea maritima (strain ATCC 700847 / DSM 10411 / MH2) TaxID=760142 RepID=F2LXL4_HIPMA|nr:UDP-N-acetylglucosamine 1-carboxyvinyltransferase [Hippea maritima]AEA33200.1 UDP-N-acetylglucosamine1-carboxyvinyltransferase [Hippea maritima DSM 10411]